VDNILSHDFEKSSLKINGFLINKKERYYFLNKGRFFKDENIFKTYSKIREYNQIALKNREIFLNLKNSEQIVTSDINHLICYLYYDLIVNFEIAAYKHNLDMDYEEEKKAIQKILGKKIEYSNKKNKKTQTDYRKSTLVQRASNTKYWHRFIHSLNLEYSIIKTAKKINPIELELPLRYDSEKVYKILNDLSNVLSFLEIKNRDFEIRFKKLGHYKKEGMYLKIQKH
jgi:hypothetical protein